MLKCPYCNIELEQDETRTEESEPISYHCKAKDHKYYTYFDWMEGEERVLILDEKVFFGNEVDVICLERRKNVN